MAQSDGEWERLALTGYGHFTTMRVERGGVRGLALHLDRLAKDCRTVFGADLDPDRVREELRLAIAGADGPVMARVTVFDPSLRIDRMAEPASPRTVVTLRAAPAAEPPPLRVRSVAFTRDLPEVKHAALFGALHRRRLAQLDGFDDAVFVDADGAFSEGPTWNLGLFDGESVVWPSGDALPGVSAALIAGAYAGRSVSRSVLLSEAAGMAAAFATSSSVGARPIAAIDGASFDPAHPVIRALREAYESIEPERI
jgi:branched-subunit amino acid aminotransferase/4-amino-4-deoxychorismate lyase